MNTTSNEAIIYRFWFKNLDNGAELYSHCLILRDVREFINENFTHEQALSWAVMGELSHPKNIRLHRQRRRFLRVVNPRPWRGSRVKNLPHRRTLRKEFSC